MQSELTLDNLKPEAPAADLPTLFIRPPKGWMSIGFRELWEYRELLYFLTWRDIKVRYKQTALGAAWAIIQPLLTMLVFSVFLGGWQKFPPTGFLIRHSSTRHFCRGSCSPLP